jgi:hypothetical protein
MSVRSPIVYDIRVRTYMEFIEKCIITTTPAADGCRTSHPDIFNQLEEEQTISLLKSIEKNTICELERQENTHRCMVQLALLTEEEFTTLNNKHEAQKSGTTMKISQALTL